jgi:ribosomal protein S18 acetylase RimI-like enzyme
MIVALNETCGAALEQPLRRAGYSESHQLLMVLDAPLSAEEWGTAISELSAEALTSSRMAAQLQLKDGDPRIASQLISREKLLEALLSERCLAVLAGDRVLARCQLYRQGQVAQIDHLYTDPAHRRRGFARALVTHAARLAQAAGAETVFLLTDLTGTPQNMYRQIGFSEANVVHRFRARHRR